MSIDYFGQKLVFCSMFVLFTKLSKLERKQNKQRVNSVQIVSKQGEPIGRLPKDLPDPFRRCRPPYSVPRIGLVQVAYPYSPTGLPERIGVSYGIVGLYEWIGSGYTKGYTSSTKGQVGYTKGQVRYPYGSIGVVLYIMSYPRGYITYPKVLQCNKKQQFVYPFGYIIIPYCIIYLVITDSQPIQ